MTKKILIIDDELIITKTLEKILSENDTLEVFSSNSGEDGIKKCEAIIPDLVILDIMMPGTPVREIVKKIKDVKISYLSVVRTSEAEKEKLLGQNNIVDFIQKPFDIKDLVKRVKKIVGN